MPHGKRRILLPGVTVYIKNTGTNAVSPKSATDGRGRYTVPEMPAGYYVVCWDAEGYRPGCAPDKQAFAIQTGTAAPSPTQIEPVGPVVMGRVSLANGQACSAEYPIFDLNIKTRITLVDSSGQVTHNPVLANQRGEFIIPASATGSGRIQAECDGLKAEANLPERGAFAKLAIASARPQIRAVFAGTRSRIVRHARPGATIPVSVNATVSDQGRLHYRWFASAGAVVTKSQDSATVNWALPKVSGSHTMYVMVSGENGGHSIGQISVLTGPPGAIFSGTATDASGAALAGASVSVNGQATTTNAQGYFFIQLAQDSSRYILDINKDGYAALSRIMGGEVVGATFSLVKSQANTVDPTHPIDVSQSIPNRPGAQLQIPANALVDAQGKPPAGALVIYISTVDLHDPAGRLPGNFAGKSIAGQRVRLSSYGGVDVQIRDTAGNPYNLARGKTATVRIPADPAVSSPPATLPFWFYNQRTGLWEQGGSAKLSSRAYEFGVPHFSSISVGFTSTNSACIAVNVDPGTVGNSPFPLAITFADSTGAAHTTTATVDPATPPATISELPPNVPVTLQISNFDLAVQTINSGGPIPAADDATDPPTADCGAVAYLVIAPTAGIGTEPDAPGESPSAVSPGGFLDYFGLDDETSADAYYAAIDPASLAGAGTVASAETAPASLPASCAAPVSGAVQAGSVPLVTGTGTAFTTFFVAGDMVQMGAVAPRTISAVCDDAHLVTFSVQAAPGPPTIGAGTAYARIGSKTTLTRFQSVNTWTTDQATATYFNANDLGFGRSMHMSPWTGGPPVAYYVSNFHNVEQARLASAASILDGSAVGLIATVAMEYSPTPPGTAPYTKFYVFNAKGARVNNADLDQRGAKFVPRLCMICHAGRYVAPTPANQGNEGSRFIGFDLASYGYSGFDVAFSRGGQEQAFRLLNQAVLEATNPSTAQQQLLRGWYGGGAGIDTAGSTQIDGFVPAFAGSQSWSTAATPAGATVAPHNLYTDVVRTSCRTCHVNRDTPLDWNQFGGINGFQFNGATIEAFACEMRIMPQAKVTYINFWANSAPILPTTGPPPFTSNPNRRNELMNAGLNFVTSTDPCPLQ